MVGCSQTIKPFKYFHLCTPNKKTSPFIMFKFVIVTLATLAVASAKPGVLSSFAGTPFTAAQIAAAPFAAAPVATPFATQFATAPVATPFAAAPFAEAHFGYTAPQSPLAYSSFYGNSASQVDLRQNYNTFPVPAPVAAAVAPAHLPFSVPAVSPLSYASPVAKFASPFAAAPITPFGAPFKYAAAPAAPFVF
ncbi:hypothetical protein ACFFRR_011067 [Megaselia abdita]